MTLHRYAKARDANEPEVIEWLEAHGYSVERIDVPCDLIVGKARRSHLVEVKMPKEKLRTKGAVAMLSAPATHQI